MYDKSVANVNSIDTNGFVSKTTYGTDKLDLEKKIRNTSGLVKKIDYNTKITEIGNKISRISGLATNAALTTTENKILNVSSLVKKKKQIITQKLMKLKNLLTMTMINKLLLQNLII